MTLYTHRPHRRSIDLLNLLLENGWACTYKQREIWNPDSTPRSRCISVEGTDPGNLRKNVYVNWSTRKTGALGLSTCLLGLQDATLTQVKTYIARDSAVSRSHGTDTTYPLPAEETRHDHP